MRRIIVAIIVLLFCIEMLALPHHAKPEDRLVGKLIWKFNAGYRAHLAAANGVIYAASPTGCDDTVPCGPPARLFALDALTGAQKWMIEGIGDDSAPVIADGLVYQAAGSLFAVNAQTGRVEWKLKPPTYGTVMYSPVIAEGTIFFWDVNGLIPSGFFYGGTLYAFDLHTRQQKWKFLVPSGMVSRPVAGDGLIYVATRDDETLKGSLYALDAGTGRVRWKFAVAGSNPAIRQGVVYYAGADGNLYALDARRGKKLWQFKCTSRPSRAFPTLQLSSASVGDRLIYCALYRQSLHAVDSSNGHQKWEFKVELAYPHSAVADGLVYVESFEGQLYAIDATTGREIWTFKMDNGLASPPVVLNDIVYLVRHDGYIYAIK